MIYDLGDMAYRAGRRADVELQFTGPTRVQEDDLRRILNRVVRHWSENIPSIAPGGFKDAEGEDEVERTNAQGVVIAAAAVSAFWTWAERLDIWRRSQFIRVVKASVDLDVSAVAPHLINDPAFRKSAEWAVSLIRDLNDDMRRRTLAVLMAGAAKGANQKEIERGLRVAVGFGQRRAKLIARDQTQKIAEKLNELQQRAAGIDEYVWQHSFKRNPRIHHVRRQGLRFRWDKPPYDGHPGHAINCRCRASALLKVKTRREVYLNADAG